MNIYDVWFGDGTVERRTLMFFGQPPAGDQLVAIMRKYSGRTDIVKITRPMVGGKVVWSEENEK
jgi:hypothetical protein